MPIVSDMCKEGKKNRSSIVGVLDEHSCSLWNPPPPQLLVKDS